MTKKLLNLKIGQKLFIFLFFLSALAICSALLAYWGYQRISLSYQTLMENSLPIVETAGRLRINSTKLTLQTLKLLDAKTVADFIQIENDITQQIKQSERLIKQINDSTENRFPSTQDILSIIQQLSTNATQQIELLNGYIAKKPNVLQLQETGRKHIRQGKINIKLLSTKDNTKFYKQSSELSELSFSLATIESILGGILQLNTPVAIEKSQLRYKQQIRQLTQQLIQLPANVRQTLAGPINDLAKLSNNEQNIFSDAAGLIQAQQKISEIGIANGELAEELDIQLTDFTEIANYLVKNDYQKATQTTSNGRIILAVLIILSSITPVALIVFFIKPNILNRLQQLTRKTYLIAAGDLNVTIDTKGNDEISMLSIALEKFRLALIDKLQTEINLRESEQRFQLAVAGARDGIWDWPDMEQDEEYWSPQWKALLGYQDDEIEANANAFFSMLHPDDIPQCQEALEKSIADNSIPFDVEYRLRTKSGEYKWFLAKASIVENSATGKKRMTGSITDISEKKAGEQALKESEAFLQLIMQHYPDLLFVKNQKYQIIQANDAFIKSYPDSMQDKIINHTTLEQYHPEEAERFLTHDRLAFEKGYSDTVETINFPDGSLRILYTRKIRFENALGEPFILGVSRDVTERETLINQLTATNEELLHFAYVASHDLQEPLRMVTNFSKLLSDQHHEKLDETIKKYLDIICESAINMQNLVEDLLIYARTGNEENLKEIIDTKDALFFVQENLKHDIEKLHVKITYNALPEIRAHSTQFSRLLQNLIGNAIKYRQKDVAPKIHIEAKATEERWIFSISDNGIGMRSEYYQKIFLPFKRLHSKQHYPGTGIGLAICKKIIEGFNGEIWVESELGKGSIFYFTIPK